jgi:hypothetical protein
MYQVQMGQRHAARSQAASGSLTYFGCCLGFRFGDPRHTHTLSHYYTHTNKRIILHLLFLEPPSASGCGAWIELIYIYIHTYRSNLSYAYTTHIHTCANTHTHIRYGLAFPQSSTEFVAFSTAILRLKEACFNFFFPL